MFAQCVEVLIVCKHHGVADLGIFIAERVLGPHRRQREEGDKEKPVEYSSEQTEQIRKSPSLAQSSLL